MIILASASPRRAELMKSIGLTFEIRPTGCDENCSIEEPGKYVSEISRRKAETALEGCESGDIVIAADTCVFVCGKILGKPQNEQEAAEMLSMLSGRTHTVYTGLWVCKNGAATQHIERTEVTFRRLEDSHIRMYIESGEPFDKAGGYGIQGLGSMLVERIEGDFFNVMGLPVCALYKILEGLGQVK